MLCRIVGIEDQTYGDWRNKRLVSPFPKPLTERNALELAVVALLNRELRRPMDFDMVCTRLRGKLTDRLRKGQVVVVCHLADNDAELCFDDAEVGRAVSHGREVRAIRVDVEIARVLEAFRRQVARLAEQE